MIGRKRVLIIDEDRRTVDRLQETFSQFGFEAEIALSVLVGQSIAAERYMSVVLINAKIGNESNWEAVRRLKESDPNLPVVLFNAPKGLSKEARRAGVAKFISTEADAQMLFSEARKVMRN